MISISQKARATAKQRNHYLLALSLLGSTRTPRSGNIEVSGSLSPELHAKFIDLVNEWQTEQEALAKQSQENDHVPESH